MLRVTETLLLVVVTIMGAACERHAEKTRQVPAHTQSSEIRPRPTRPATTVRKDSDRTPTFADVSEVASQRFRELHDIFDRFQKPSPTTQPMREIDGPLDANRRREHSSPAAEHPTPISEAIRELEVAYPWGLPSLG